MQSAQKFEYDALVARVRAHYGSGVEIGGYNSHDLLKLRGLDAQREVDQARTRAERPLVEANTRLHHTRERAMKAWRTITEGQATLAKNRRLHAINGVAAEMLEPVAMPTWDARHSATVAESDAANAETAVMATETEARAGKISNYVSGWEQSTMDEQNRSLILALADRLDRLEGSKACSASVTRAPMKGPSARRR
jgi:ElaB/YqjD/DUF883 family membrane-anchored ribosome-binding protein